MSANIGRALFSLRPNCEFTLKNNDYSTIEWIVLEGDAPSAAEVEAEIKKIEAADAEQEAQTAAKKAAILERLGITEEEAKLLLG